MKKSPIALGILFALSQATVAQTVTEKEVIVTATRVAQTADTALASVTVLDRQTIEKSQATTVTDLLRGVAGIDITRNGGKGKSASVFMRGTASDHVLVLIDGVRVGSATTGTASFQYLPTSQIERIEVVRGPRSSLYGSEAIGGVIQIFTRQASKTPRITASVGGGSDSTYQVTAGISGKNNNTWYSAYIDRFATDGFNACAGSTSGGCYTIEPDDDAYDNTAFNVRLGQQVSENLSIEGYMLRATGNTEHDSSRANELDFVQQVIGLKTTLDINDKVDTTLNIGQSRDETDSFGHDKPVGVFNTETLNVSWQTNWAVSENSIFTFGYDYKKDDIDSTVAYAIDSRDNHGYFLQYQGQYGNTDLVASIRNDDNEQFGNRSTGSIALGYRISPTVRSFLSYGTAFKAPSFNELYYPNFGDANINPEESKSLELGFAGNEKEYNWSFSVYRTEIDQLIGGYPVQNVDEATINGIEASFGMQIAGWDVRTSFDWLKPEDDKTGNLLPRRAEKTFKLALDRQLGQWQMGADVIAQSHRFDDVKNTKRVAGYGVLDMRAEYSFNKNWSLKARIDNVFNKEYELIRHYNTPDRAYFISVHYQN